MLTNGLEAIVVTDVRVSGAGRETDSANKMAQFLEENYAGVIYGAGSASQIKSIVDNISKFSGETLEEFVEDIHSFYKKFMDEKDARFLAAARKEIEKKAQLFPEKERARFIEREISELMDRYDRSRRDPQTELVLVALDKERRAIRSFLIRQDAYLELFADHLEIGSGADGANFYFATKLQGLDTKNLDVASLAFHAINAYGYSTVNRGVGGTPKVARIGPDRPEERGLQILDREQTLPMLNLSGAYLTDNVPGLSGKNMTEYFKQVLTGTPDYSYLASKLGINNVVFTTLNIPYSSWQERANGKVDAEIRKEIIVSLGK